MRRKGGLLKESFTCMICDGKSLILQLILPVLMMGITYYMTGKDMYFDYYHTRSAGFILVCAVIWGGLFNSITLVVKERQNVKMKLSKGISPMDFVWSRTIPQMILCAIQSAIITSSIYVVSTNYNNPVPETGLLLDNVYVEYGITFWLLSISADMLGLFVSCLAKKTTVAIATAPYILLAQLVFSGMVLDLKDWSETVSKFMLSRWGIAAFGTTSNLNALSHGEEQIFTFTRYHLLSCWGVLGLFAVVCIITSWFTLKFMRLDEKS